MNNPEMMTRLLTGDCLEIMPTLDAESIDAVVTDPPYGFSFMGKAWDHGSPGVPFWREAIRLLKPGAHLLAFGGTRTFHRLTCAIEDAGFEIRDCLSWLYGSGFPKSLNIGDGIGTALKPAWEPIILARKPLAGTVAANVEKYGTGGLNIDGCRIGTDGGGTRCSKRDRSGKCLGHVAVSSYHTIHGLDSSGGRWPANVVLDEDAAAMVDEQSGSLSTVGSPKNTKSPENMYGYRAKPGFQMFGDSGGASRFFYTAKASRAEREEGLEAIAPTDPTEVTGRKPGSPGQDNPRTGLRGDKGRRNVHPTVKPIDLMRWLVRLVTPPGGIVLDPFMGSGTTGIAAYHEKVKFIGIEKETEYVKIAETRIVEASRQAFLF